MIIKKVILKNAYKIICLYFFMTELFFISLKKSGKMNWVKKNKKTKSHWSTVSFNVSIVIFGRSEAISPWDHAIALYSNLLAQTMILFWFNPKDHLSPLELLKIFGANKNFFSLYIKIKLPYRDARAHDPVFRHFVPQIACARSKNLHSYS